MESGEEFTLSWNITHIDIDTCNLTGSGIETIDLEDQSELVLSHSETVDYDYELTCEEIDPKTITIAGIPFLQVNN